MDGNGPPTAGQRLGRRHAGVLAPAGTGTVAARRDGAPLGRRFMVWNFVSSLTAVVGGVLGYLLLEAMHQVLPYVLALASASFIYVAMADLIPGMQRRWDPRAAVWQIFLIAAGIASIAAMHHFHD